MSFTVDTAFVNSYHAQLEHIFQQKGSKLRGTVREVSQNSEYDYWDRLGVATVQEISTRHGDTPHNEIEHTRRRNQVVGYDTNEYFDNQDKLRMIIDPKSGYAQSQAYALGRKMDDSIIAAALGTAYTGKAGAGTAAFGTGSSIASSTVAVDYVESGAATNSNLTIGKLRRALYLLEANDAIDPMESVTVAAHPSQKQALLRTTEVTNSDYNAIKALVNGEINTFLGFNFVWTTSTTTDANSYRQVLVYPKSGILLGVAENLKVRIDERPDKRYSYQVYSTATFGAARMWEERVIKILCAE
tara:strand:+ start:482 stop:1384 length:903 start_codon:yes stop_codon:yes gene_type:complete